MIEVDAFIALVVLAFIGGGITLLVSRSAQRQHAPGGTEIYRLARRMAHELEGVLLLDDNLPFLPNTQRSSIGALLKEWDKQL